MFLGYEACSVCCLECLRLGSFLCFENRWYCSVGEVNPFDLWCLFFISLRL